MAASADIGQYFGEYGEKVFDLQSVASLGDDGNFMFRFVDIDMSKNVLTDNVGVKIRSGFTKESFDWKNPALWTSFDKYRIKGFFAIKLGN